MSTVRRFFKKFISIAIMTMAASYANAARFDFCVDEMSALDIKDFITNYIADSETTPEHCQYYEDTTYYHYVDANGNEICISSNGDSISCYSTDDYNGHSLGNLGPGEWEIVYGVSCWWGGIG